MISTCADIIPTVLSFSITIHLLETEIRMFSLDGLLRKHITGLDVQNSDDGSGVVTKVAGVVTIATVYTSLH